MPPNANKRHCTPTNATERQQTPPNANKRQWQMSPQNIGKQQTPLNATARQQTPIPNACKKYRSTTNATECQWQMPPRNVNKQQMPPNTNIRNLLCIACSLLHVHNWTFLKKRCLNPVQFNCLFYVVCKMLFRIIKKLNLCMSAAPCKLNQNHCRRDSAYRKTWLRWGGVVLFFENIQYGIRGIPQ